MADLSEAEADVVGNVMTDENDVSAPDAMAAKELVHKLVAQLKPEDQLVVRLLDLEQKTIAEISGITGWSQSLVKPSNDPGRLTVTLTGGGWANVYVDGQKLSKTAPLKDWSIPPGKHTIRVENASLGIDQTQDVRVDPGGSATVKASPK